MEGLNLIIRNCSGGVVFNEESVFILKNDKNEWVLPKGKIAKNDLSAKTAINRVKYEAGIDAEIVSNAGETAYEFYSVTRLSPVLNKITWYIMESKDLTFEINKEEGFLKGGYFPIEEAIDRITYSQDKSLVSLAHKRYLEFKEFRANKDN